MSGPRLSLQYEFVAGTCALSSILPEDSEQQLIIRSILRIIHCMRVEMGPCFAEISSIMHVSSITV